MSREYVIHPAHAPRDLHIDYRAELNEQQFAAVTATGADGSLNSGPMLVIAGAGSGKTRTLTYRVAWLVEHGLPPERILLLTFTNKAAREMLRRVASVLPTDISAIWGGTFHHIGNRILRRHAALAGLQPDFTILDRDDQKELLDGCLGEARIDPKAERFPKGDVLAEIYSLVVNTGRTLEQVLAEQYDYFAHLLEPIRKLRAIYERRKSRTNVADYDDLLVKTLRLLQDHAAVAERYRDQFVHVLVDEYQDTNRIQADLIDALAAQHRNLMVVGDDAQSIYSWRGADYKNILGFPERYPGARTFKIEVNYRSVPGVLILANDAIKGNRRQFAKTLRPVRQGGSKPWLVACADASQQAQFVAQRLLELRDEGTSLNEIAVLYRAHYHAMELQMELTRRNVPYIITSGLRFFEQAHVKDVSSFLKIVVNPHDELSFKRLARLLAGVGPKAADKLWAEYEPRLAQLLEPRPELRSDSGSTESLSFRASEESESLAPAPDLRHGSLDKPGMTPAENATSGQGNRPPRGDILPLAAAAVPKKAAGEWKQFATVINELAAMPVPRRARAMIETAVHGFYEPYAKAKYPNARNRLEDLTQLASFADQFEKVEDFLSQLALLTNLEADDASLITSTDQEYVRLSTVHQAKGQEWRAVFAIGLCDGMFPLARSLDSLGGEEEERRLFYVAVTRAKDELYLTYPLFRQGQGDSGGFQRPSRFLAEVPKQHYQELALRYQSRGW